MENPTAIDSEGNPMRKHWVFTYCGADDADSARGFAMQFFDDPKRGLGDFQPSDMLNVPLRPVGSTGTATAYGCVRECWTDELDEQRAFMASNCSSIPSFACIESDLVSALDALGLEVIR